MGAPRNLVGDGTQFCVVINSWHLHQFTARDVRRAIEIWAEHGSHVTRILDSTGSTMCVYSPDEGWRGGALARALNVLDRGQQP